jgi:hypothetical protein
MPLGGSMTIGPNLAEQPVRSFRIDEELSQILHSSTFQGSKQCQALLKYLVEKSIGGQTGDSSLKERTIGIEVFGRKHDYNTADDAIVRARVGEVRKRLAQYYQSLEGQGATVQITIPHGTYRPTFTFRLEKDDESKNSPVKNRPQAESSRGADEYLEPGAAASVSRSRRPARWLAWGIVAVAACAIASVTWIGIPKWTKSDLDLFWAPFLESTKPAVIYMGTAQLYVPAAVSTEEALSLLSPNELKQPMTEWPLPPLVEGQVLKSNDVLIDRKDFVGIGDIAAVVNVATYFSAHHRSLDLRSGPNLPFEDLRGSPVILTGAGSNYWTLDIARDLPFFVDRGLRIRERGGQGRVWTTPLWSDHTIAEDYAIVARLLDSKTGAPVVILAGITMCGNQAAGEFVTNPLQLKKLGSIPRDAFEHKNIEIVLHTTLSNCTPTSMDVVAQRYW